MVQGSRIPIAIDDEYEDDLMINEENKKIFVKVSGLEGENDIFFKTEIHLPLQWVMVKYCDIKRVDYESTRFEFNGSRIRHMDTPYLLGMANNDSIYASPASGVNGNSAVQYVALCIRMHKERSIFHRVRRRAPLLPQLVQYFSDVAHQDHSSISFVYNGLKISQNHTADLLNMEDGDVIDGFNFHTMSSYLTKTAPRFTLTIRSIITGGDKYHFSVTPATSLGRLMDKYSQLVDTPIDRLTFIGNGRRLRDEQTVEEVQLKDGDTITIVHCLRGS